MKRIIIMVFSSNTVRSEILLRTKHYKDLTILQCVVTVSINDSSVESANMIITETSCLA